MNGIANKYAVGYLFDIEGQSYYKTFADCINENSIYMILGFILENKKKLILQYGVIQNLQKWISKRLGITDDKIMIRIKRI